MKEREDPMALLTFECPNCGERQEHLPTHGLQLMRCRRCGQDVLAEKPIDGPTSSC